MKLKAHVKIVYKVYVMTNIKFNFNNSYVTLPEILYTYTDPIKVSNPKIVIVNKDLMLELGLNDSDMGDNELANLLSGNVMPEGSDPVAMAYAGHQFGGFTLLGDGRAHLIGEHIAPNSKRYDVHLKGSGRTPYARGGDGRAALGPMLREYIMSEAMYALGIATTRSLAVTATGETVPRETPLAGAVLTRIASSHIRIGTFEYAAHKQNPDLVKCLLDYTIQRHYLDVKNANNPAIALLKGVIEKQTDLITHWMRVGFIHGVMNTDNMTLSGETIDYGPCAFMDVYDAKTVFSSIDRNARYAYGNQPLMAQWNIARLAESLLPLIDPNIDKAIEIAEDIVNGVQDIYAQKWLNMMRAKLGLCGKNPQDKQLIDDLLSWMTINHIDYTNCFRSLSSDQKPQEKVYHCRKFNDWYQKWQNRLALEKSKQASISLMRQNNPAIIPRNHNVENALEQANAGNMQPFNDLLAALKTPYCEHENIKCYQSPPQPSERVFQTFCGT